MSSGPSTALFYYILVACYGYTCTYADERYRLPEPPFRCLLSYYSPEQDDKTFRPHQDGNRESGGGSYTYQEYLKRLPTNADLFDLYIEEFADSRTVESFVLKCDGRIRGLSLVVDDKSDEPGDFIRNLSLIRLDLRPRRIDQYTFAATLASALSPSLRFLTVRNCMIPPDAIKSLLVRCPGLEGLELISCRIDSRVVFSKGARLSHLLLQNTERGPLTASEALDLIGRDRAVVLRTLVLSDFSFTLSNMQDIAINHPNLESLVIGPMSDFSDAMLDVLASQRRLRYLKFCAGRSQLNDRNELMTYAQKTSSFVTKLKARSSIATIESYDAFFPEK